MLLPAAIVIGTIAGIAGVIALSRRIARRQAGHWHRTAVPAEQEN